MESLIGDGVGNVRDAGVRAQGVALGAMSALHGSPRVAHRKGALIPKQSRLLGGDTFGWKVLKGRGSDTTIRV